MDVTWILIIFTLGIMGSFISGSGSFISNRLPSSAINQVYAVLALIAAVLMFLHKNGAKDAPDTSQITFNKTLTVTLALMIGLVSGIVGAAGAFITVPVMLVVLKIPTGVAVASSLAITFLASIGSTTGKLLGGHMLLIPSIVLIVASTLASPLGAKTE